MGPVAPKNHEKREFELGVAELVAKERDEVAGVGMRALGGRDSKMATLDMSPKVGAQRFPDARDCIGIELLLGVEGMGLAEGSERLGDTGVGLDSDAAGGTHCCGWDWDDGASVGAGRKGEW